MLEIYATYNGLYYQLPDPQAEQDYPKLKQVRENIELQFEKFISTYPDETIKATWNEKTDMVDIQASTMIPLQVLLIIDQLKK